MCGSDSNHLERQFRVLLFELLINAIHFLGSPTRNEACLSKSLNLTSFKGFSSFDLRITDTFAFLNPV